MADWYYIGHYGQLGPLTREQINDLIQGGVIARDTYVWASGLPDWQPAEKVPDLKDSFAPMMSSAPPPPPTSRPAPFPDPPPRSYSPNPIATYNLHQPVFSSSKSDRSRLVGGILNLLIPGVGRMYLGYSAIGVLQLVLTLCGVGYIWSFIDGILILSGSVRMDGYGRELPE